MSLQSFHGFHDGLITPQESVDRSMWAFGLFFSDCDFAWSLCKEKKKVVDLEFDASDTDGKV